MSAAPRASSVRRAPRCRRRWRAAARPRRCRGAAVGCCCSRCGTWWPQPDPTLARTLARTLPLALALTQPHPEPQAQNSNPSSLLLPPTRRSCTRRRLLTWGRVSATWTKRRMAKVALPRSSPMRPPTLQEPACWSGVLRAPPWEPRALTERALERSLCSSVPYAPAPAPSRRFRRLSLSRRGPTRCGSRRSGRWWASPSMARSSTCCSTCPPSGPTARRSGCSRGGRSFNPQLCLRNRGTALPYFLVCYHPQKKLRAASVTLWSRSNGRGTTEPPPRP